MTTVAELNLLVSAKDNASHVLGNVDKSAGSLLGTLGKMAAVGVAAAGALGSAAVGLAAAAGISFKSTQQQMTMSLAVMLKSEDAANDLFERVRVMAAKTPFEMNNLMKGVQTLLNYGWDPSKVLSDLTTIGDAAAAMPEGMNMGLERITRAFGQMMSKGKATGEEMRQLVEGGIPAWQMLATQMGKSTAEVQKMVEKGAISADQAIAMILNGMDERYGGMMEKQAHTFSGLMSTIKDNFNQFMGVVMGPLFEKLTQWMQKLVDYMDTPAWEEFQQKAAAAIQTVTDAFAEFVENVGSAVLPVIRDIVMFFVDHYDQIVAFGQAVAGVVVPAFVAVAEALKSWTIEYFIPNLQAFLTVLGAIAVVAIDLGQKIGETLAPAFEKIAAALNDPAILNGLAVAAIITLTVNMYALATASFAAAAGMMAAYAVPLLLTVAIGLLIGSIIWLITNWDMLTERYAVLGAANDAVVASFNTLVGVIKSIIDWFREHDTVTKTIILTLGLLVTVALLPLIAAVTAVIGIVKLLVGHFDDIVAGAQTILGALVDVGQAFWDLAKDIAGFAEDAAGVINDFFGGLPKFLFDIGIDIVQGLWDGISDKWEDFIDWLWDKVGDIPGVLKKFLGINSPSRLMAEEVGEPIPEGIAAGIEDGWPMIDSALNATGNAIVAKVNAIRNTVVSMMQSLFNSTPAAPSTFDRIEYAAAGGDAAVLNPFGSVDMERSGEDAATKALRAFSTTFGGSGGKGGGGGGGSKAKEEAISAVQGFMNDVAAKMQEQELIDKYGEAGAKAMLAFTAAMAEGADGKDGEKLSDAVMDMIKKATDEGIPGAKELGQNIITALGTALTDKTPEAIAAAESAIGQLASKFKTAALTIDDALAEIAESDRMQKVYGSMGVKMLDAFNDAIKKGTPETIRNVAGMATDIKEKLMDVLGEKNGAALATQFLEALRNGINEKSPEAIAAFDDMMKRIGQIISGGAYDLKTGTTMIADDVNALAKALGLSADDIVQNFSAIVESGILSVLGPIEKLPQDVREAIAQVIKEIEAGKIAAEGAGPAIARAAGIGTGPPPGPSNPGKTYGETIQNPNGWTYIWNGTEWITRFNPSTVRIMSDGSSIVDFPEQDPSIKHHFGLLNSSRDHQAWIRRDESVLTPEGMREIMQSTQGRNMELTIENITIGANADADMVKQALREAWEEIKEAEYGIEASQYGVPGRT